MKIKIISFLFASIFAFSSLFASIVKANEVKIGVLLPLTGPVAQIGLDAKAAIETFISMRIRITEGDDKFFLFTTDSAQHTISSWQHPVEHLIHSLRQLTPTR